MISLSKIYVYKLYIIIYITYNILYILYYIIILYYNKLYIVPVSFLKEIDPEHPLEGLMLKLQYFGHLMQRADSLEKTLMLGKIEGKRRKGQQRMKWLDGISLTQWT